MRTYASRPQQIKLFEMHSPIKDFETAMTHAAAEAAGANLIVSRNVKDFEKDLYARWHLRFSWEFSIRSIHNRVRS